MDASEMPALDTPVKFTEGDNIGGAVPLGSEARELHDVDVSVPERALVRRTG
jgi:hypothetical protein